jgi:hypothetical protein
MRKTWVRAIVLFAVVFAVTAIPAVVMAQNESPPAPSFDEWLALVGGPGLGAAVAVLLSVLAEQWEGYQSLSSKLKSLIYMGSCLLLGIGSACLRAAMGYVPWSFDPLIWQALWNALAQYGVGRFGRDMFWKAKKI